MQAEWRVYLVSPHQLVYSPAVTRICHDLDIAAADVALCDRGDNNIARVKLNADVNKISSAPALTDTMGQAVTEQRQRGNSSFMCYVSWNWRDSAQFTCRVAGSCSARPWPIEERLHGVRTHAQTPSAQWKAITIHKLEVSLHIWTLLVNIFMNIGDL